MENGLPKKLFFELDSVWIKDIKPILKHQNGFFCRKL
jgi:hypothetical protein